MILNETSQRNKYCNSVFKNSCAYSVYFPSDHVFLHGYAISGEYLSVTTADNSTVLTNYYTDSIKGKGR